MSQTAIPLQFERYLQNLLSLGKAPDMNQMIFAYLPALDLGLPIDREQGLPDVSTWVHEQDIDQVGKVGENALAYSVVIPSSVPEFTFNAIYLRDKNTLNSCGVVVHKIDETKEAGMSSTKSLLQAYSGAASIAGITVDAATWQIDYQARLLGLDEDHRLSCLDNYGHTSFESGFEVTQEADPTKYKTTAGLVYVGGLRALLENEVMQTIISKPNAIYVDVFRDGSVLSQQINNVALVTSETPLTDYIDESGKQHYVTIVATINADGSVTDERITYDPISAELTEHTNAYDPHSQYAQKDDLTSQEYITGNTGAITNKNKLHIFIGYADLQIPDDSGALFKFVVDDSVDLDAGKCRLLAPIDSDGITIQMKVSAVLSDACNIKNSGVIHTVIKVNGVWKV